MVIEQKIWPVVSLVAVIQDMQPGFARRPNSKSIGIAQLRTNNVSNDGNIDLTEIKYVDATEIEIKKYGVQKGDVIFNNTNSPELVGRAAYFGLDQLFVLSNHMTRLRVTTDLLDAEFLARYLNYLWQIGASSRWAKHWVNQAAIDQSGLEQFDIPLPPLLEQRRIVAILRKADELRQLRRQANARAQQLLPALFDEMFGDFSYGSDHDWLKLEEVADVVSGVTKGRRLPPSKTVTVPYLRVANVQAGYIDLTEIKTIEALPSEVEQYRLQYGDVVLTEGGDFDKLGRGAMWTHDIPNCIHQNHVFRVRLKPEFLHPLFFTQFLTTNFAKVYFLQAAKQTTNLASINMTQLRALPVPIPLMTLQQAFVKKVEKANGLLGMQSASDETSEHLFQSLLTRAFTGELTTAWREAHATELTEAAAERDRLLNKPIPLAAKPLLIAPPDLGAPILTVKPSRAIYADLDAATQSLWAAAQTRPAYFRPADLLNGTDLTTVQAEAGLRILAALGFVRQVGLEGQLVYRRVDPIAESATKPEFLP